MKFPGTVGFILLALIPVHATGQTDVYANPENLEVLPDDISSRDLSNTMRGFAMGLGVRCETCHVGEAGQPLSSFDFASDEREMKIKARSMMRMADAINADYISGLDDIAASDHGPRVSVRCVTCHRGQRLPKMTEEVLDDSLQANGLDAALEKYAELRGEYYGTHTFDFNEYMLPFFAQDLASRQQLSEAIAFLELNTAQFPESSYTYFTLGEANTRAGNSAAAIGNFMRAIEIDPGMANFLQPKIDALKAE